MKLVIYGSDTFDNITPEFISTCLSTYGVPCAKITEVIDGGLGPVDRAAQSFVRYYNSCLMFPSHDQCCFAVFFWIDIDGMTLH